MSILIKGMEMPKSCYSCNFCQYYAEPNQGCYCLALFADLHRTNFVKERLVNCPLIEVPTPHGRLIDADALQLEAYNMMFHGHADDRDVAFVNFNLEKAPTIIGNEE